MKISSRARSEHPATLQYLQELGNLVPADERLADLQRTNTSVMESYLRGFDDGIATTTRNAAAIVCKVRRRFGKRYIEHWNEKLPVKRVDGTYGL